MSDRTQQVQKLLADATKLFEEATKIATEDEMDGITFLDRTFHIFGRNHWSDHEGRINEPGWYTDEYWNSSTADCEIYVPYPDEEEEP